MSDEKLLEKFSEIYYRHQFTGVCNIWDKKLKFSLLKDAYCYKIAFRFSVFKYGVPFVGNS